MLREIKSPINPFCPEQGLTDRTVTITSAGVIVFVDTGKDALDLLLTRQADQPNKPWGIPAGRVEPTDLSLEDTAKREVREETGLEFKNEELVEFGLIMTSTHLNRRAGLFVTFIDVSRLNTAHNFVDSDGVMCFPPPVGVDTQEIDLLGLVSPDHLKYSIHTPLGRKLYRKEALMTYLYVTTGIQ